MAFDGQGKPISIQEKPKVPPSHYAVTGLYFFDNEAQKIVKGLRPSSRGELEITDLIDVYLTKDLLNVEKLGRGTAWLDTGTHESLQQASNFIETIEARQGLKVACIEEIAYRMGYITAEQLERLAEPLSRNEYGRYLLQLLEADGAGN